MEKALLLHFTSLVSREKSVERKKYQSGQGIHRGKEEGRKRSNGWTKHRVINSRRPASAQKILKGGASKGRKGDKVFEHRLVGKKKA